MEGVTLEPGKSLVWTFELSAPAAITLETEINGGDVWAVETDTVIELSNTDDTWSDDDASEGRLSLLFVDVLKAGTYRVALQGFNEKANGQVTLRGTCEGAGCPVVGPIVPSDPWALATDVSLQHVEFTDATPIPSSFTDPEGIDPIGLNPGGGAEWWQRWSGGYTQDMSFGNGTDYGKRCAQAAGYRLEAIMATEEGRAAIERLQAETGWHSTMYNWVEDISSASQEDRRGGAHGGPDGVPDSIWFDVGMWAWRTGTIKWISVVHQDGSCDLPTLELVKQFVDQCVAQAARGDGADIEGCRVHRL